MPVLVPSSHALAIASASIQCRLLTSQEQVEYLQRARGCSRMFLGLQRAALRLLDGLGSPGQRKGLRPARRP
jgi:hypothetical protein